MNWIVRKELRFLPCSVDTIFDDVNQSAMIAAKTNAAVSTPNNRPYIHGRNMEHKSEISINETHLKYTIPICIQIQ